jgi:hypothetical protein
MRIGGGGDVFRENLPHCQYVHHKFHVTWSGIETRPPLWEASEKSLEF